MKLKVTILTITLCFFYSFTFAQNWSLQGNTLSGNESFGSINGQSLNFITFGKSRMIIKPDGSIGIGTSKTDGFLLSVDGKIRAREVYINLDAWADHVFDADYDLMPLGQLESFILTHRHLPGIPGEGDMVRSDVSVNDLQVMLLEKIEELTLYMIRLNKRLEALETKSDEN